MSLPHAWREPLRRGAVAGLVMSLHLLALLMLMRPFTLRPFAAPVRRAGRQALQLRFFRRLPHSSADVRLPAISINAPAVRVQTAPSAHLQKAPTAPHAMSPSLPSSVQWLPASRDTPIGMPGAQGTIADGGFQRRLLHARRADAIRGVPGSDVPFVGGISLIALEARGAAAVMRRAQRLFGVANRHCIDVDVWHHMTPQALSARHISPNEVDQVDEAYHCNRPPGLSF